MENRKKMHMFFMEVAKIGFPFLTMLRSSVGKLIYPVSAQQLLPARTAV